MSGTKAVARALAALLCGTLFGVGLAVAQMTDPRKVLNFLDITGRWDASLLLVLGAATGLYAVAHVFIRKRASPVLDTQFHQPIPTQVDARLLGGSALFGAGWGVAGYCPGPAVASLGIGNAEALWVVPSIVVGIVAHRYLATFSRRAALQ